MEYIARAVYQDNRINIICDRLFFYIMQKFENKTIANSFILTGSSAFQLQETVPLAARNIVFTTNDLEIYNYLLLELSFLKAKEIVKFKNRILIDLEFCKIEIWLRVQSYTIVPFGTSNVFLEEKTTIPTILL